jgi:hypothetical protein
MQQCWLKLVSHCLGPGAALENMFAWVIVAYLQILWAHLVFWGVFLGRNWVKKCHAKCKHETTFKMSQILHEMFILVL